jgi:proteic killer suppression protein
MSKLMNDDRALARKYGSRQADLVRQRLDDLQAVPCLEIMYMLPGRCHQLSGDQAGEFSVDLVHPQRLIFEPADDPPALLKDGGVDRRRVKAVRILGVEDTHE